MPDYKKQHYLPASYLKHFAADQVNSSRKSLIWRIDEKTQRQVRVESQCFENYFYSKGQAAETEKMFQRTEIEYEKCVIKIKAKKQMNRQDELSLIIAMFDLHLRNAQHENCTNQEGVHAYKLRNNLFMQQVLLGRRDGDVSGDDIVNYLNKHWDVRIISTPTPEVGFITSDNPCIWIALNPGRPSLDVVLLPISPSFTAVAFDKRMAKVVSDHSTHLDVQTLDAIQIGYAMNCVYSSDPLDDRQHRWITSQREIKELTRGSIDEHTWKTSLAGLLPKYAFSFIRIPPPLM